VKNVVRKKSASLQAILFYLVNLIAIAILEGRVPGAILTMAERKLTADRQTAIAARMSGRASADGFPELSSWEAAGSLRFQADWQGKNADPERETEVRLLWTRETLYLRFRAKYRVITVFADAEPNGRRDHLWDRDVAEVFLQPNESDRRHYKEFEISPNGMWIDLDIAPGKKHDLKSELRRRVTLNEARKTWIAELALPMKSLAERFDPAASWRVNFYRVEGASEPRFYSAWQPTGTPAPNFHVPEAFGKLIFADSAGGK
jgi:alpha-galactosidase